MIISIGNFSASIADQLSKTYKIYKFVSQNSSDASLTMKQWEDSFDINSLASHLSSLTEQKNVFIILDPDENISGISLRFVEYLKSINPDVNIYMTIILKDKNSLTKEKIQNQNLNFLVWQEIARCGEIARTFLIDLSLVITKFKINLRNFQKTVSESVSRIIQNCIFILENEPIYGVKFSTEEIRRISSFGVVFLDEPQRFGEEFFFFAFQQKFEGNESFRKSDLSTEVLSQKHYIFYLNEEELSDGDGTLSKINSLLDSKGRNCSYSIYESGAKNSVYYAIKSTSYVETPKD